MLNSQPVQLKWQRQAMVPVLLILLALAGGAVAWLHQVRPASAEPISQFRNYEGNANVRVKSGSTWQVYPVYVCTTVEVDGSGNMVDVSTIAFPEGTYPPGEIPGESPCPDSETSEPGVLPPGAFYVDTTVNESTTPGGTGWKSNPVKNTATQWTFTMKKADLEAAAVFLNGSYRPLQAGATQVTKFLRDKTGLYFKIVGQVPQNDSGSPRVQVEIETLGGGLEEVTEIQDEAPVFLSSDSANSDTADSDTSFELTFSEPVNIDASQVSMTCSGNPFPNLYSITDNGTATPVIVPAVALPVFSWCELTIPAAAITDVDTIDPPDEAVQPVNIGVYVMPPPV